MRRKWLYILLFALVCVGCREYKVSDDPTLRLAFSCDTLSFDTVFTEQGSATLQLMVYNPNRNALVISHIDGLKDSSAFHVNIDGEQRDVTTSTVIATPTPLADRMRRAGKIL